MKVVRTLTILLMTVILAWSVPARAMDLPDLPAEGSGEGSAQAGSYQDFRLEMETETVETSDQVTDDNETLFDGYVNSLFYGRKKSTMLRVARVSLSGIEGKVYRILSGMIQEVAAGERSSTEFEISADELGIQLFYTAAELGVDSIIEGGSIADDAVEALSQKGNVDIKKLISLLGVNYPYDLYWFDKTKGIERTGFRLSATYNYSLGEYVLGFEGTTVFRFAVAQEYAAGSYTVDTSIGSTVWASAARAAGIVDAYASASDVDKLAGYKEKICELVSYNHYAADNDVPYGNPWQLIWVFDGDSSTNVVYEGYSKAFQYLCDLTTFQSSIRSILASGTMTGGTGAGRHMWNIVTMNDGCNYLVDVTNCDAGTVGADDLLFLAGYASGNLEDGYSFDCHGSVIQYVYNNDTRNLYSEAELTIASEDLAGKIKQLDGLKVLRLPDSLTAIEEEAFAGSDGEAVIIPEGCTSIGPRAFADCGKLVYVRIPEGATVAGSAFEGSENAVIDYY